MTLRPAVMHIAPMAPFESDEQCIVVEVEPKAGFRLQFAKMVHAESKLVAFSHQSLTGIPDKYGGEVELERCCISNRVVIQMEILGLAF